MLKMAPGSRLDLHHRALARLWRFTCSILEQKAYLHWRVYMSTLLFRCDLSQIMNIPQVSI